MLLPENSKFEKGNFKILIQLYISSEHKDFFTMIENHLINLLIVGKKLPLEIGAYLVIFDFQCVLKNIWS